MLRVGHCFEWALRLASVRSDCDAMRRDPAWAVDASWNLIINDSQTRRVGKQQLERDRCPNRTEFNSRERSSGFQTVARMFNYCEQGLDAVLTNKKAPDCSGAF